MGTEIGVPVGVVFLAIIFAYLALLWRKRKARSHAQEDDQSDPAKGPMMHELGNEGKANESAMGELDALEPPHTPRELAGSPGPPDPQRYELE